MIVGVGVLVLVGVGVGVEQGFDEVQVVQSEKVPNPDCQVNVIVPTVNDKI